jgi:hypothetical protein
VKEGWGSCEAGICSILYGCLALDVIAGRQSDESSGCVGGGKETGGNEVERVATPTKRGQYRATSHGTNRSTVTFCDDLRTAELSAICS